MATSVKSSTNRGPYHGPPVDRCPYCYMVGRGSVSLIPVMSGMDEVTWLCQNWRICLFPHIYGPEAVKRSIVPRRSVDPSLLGYIPLGEGDVPPGQRRIVNVADEDNSPPLSDVAPSPPVTRRPPSIISHCTTSSEGSDHDLVQFRPSFNVAPPVTVTAQLPIAVNTVPELTYTTLMPAAKPTPIVIPMEDPDIFIEQFSPTNFSLSGPHEMLAPTTLTTSASAPVLAIPVTEPVVAPLVAPPTKPKPLPQPSSYASIAFGRKRAAPTTTTTASISVPAPAAQSTPPASVVLSNARKRPLATTKPDKPSFPAYGSDKNELSASKTTKADATAAIMSMVAKRLAKVKKSM